MVEYRLLLSCEKFVLSVFQYDVYYDVLSNNCTQILDVFFILTVLWRFLFNKSSSANLSFVLFVICLKFSVVKLFDTTDVKSPNPAYILSSRFILIPKLSMVDLHGLIFTVLGECIR